PLSVVVVGANVSGVPRVQPEDRRRGTKLAGDGVPVGPGPGGGLDRTATQFPRRVVSPAPGNSANPGVSGGIDADPLRALQRPHVSASDFADGTADVGEAVSAAQRRS